MFDLCWELYANIRRHYRAPSKVILNTKQSVNLVAMYTHHRMVERLGGLIASTKRLHARVPGQGIVSMFQPISNTRGLPWHSNPSSE